MMPASEGFRPLLDILRCPVSRAPLVFMPLPELQREALSRGRIPEAATGAMVSTAAARAYPIIGQVISFLDDDVLEFSSAPAAALIESPAAAIMSEVKRWYDEFGWKRTSTGEYGDTALFSQQGQTAHGFYEMSSHLSLLDRFRGGDLFLDAASGAIAHPEYLAYTWFYRYRVCVDLSLTALQEAAAKLGNRGFYCMADMCRLPFRDNAFDGIVSGYTIQHIAASEQHRAINELVRVLGPQKPCCIITDLEASQGLRRRVLRKALALLGRAAGTPDRPAAEHPDPSHPSSTSLYCHNRSFGWWKQVLSDLDCDSSLKALRLLSKDEFETRFGDSLTFAKFLRVLETSLPRLLARDCRYILVELSKMRASV